MNILEALVAAMAVMYAIWQNFDPRFLLFFVFFMVVGEIFVKIRWRTSVPCPHCGFDPVLYVKDSALAAEKVKQHLERRKNNPEKLLAKPLHLPTLTPERAKALEAVAKNTNNRGRLVSKQI